ncbi:MAG: hypothetical protein P8172_14045 [Gammaproteobacteria bacterium]
MKAILMSGVLMVGAFSFSPAQAQMTCDDLNFSAPMTQRFPDPNAACFEVISRDGRPYAQFKAIIERVRGNTVYAKFRLRDGGRTDTYRFDMPADARVNIGGRTYRYRDLNRGQEVNVYLPEGDWEVHIPETATFSTAAPTEVIVIRPVYEEPPAARSSSMLPSTASPLPLIGMLGGLFTGLGMVLFGIRRRIDSGK